jgi:Trehalase
VSIVRAHNPTDQTQTIYVDPVIATDEVFESWDVETRWPEPVAEKQSSSGHEPRSISLRFRQRLRGLDVDSRFRYAVVDEPPIALAVAGGGTASGIRSGLFAKRRLTAADPGAYRAFGHRIGPGKTKVFKAALELRAANEPSTIESIVKPANDRTAVITADAQDTRDPLAAHVREYQAWFDAAVPYFDCSDPWVRKLYYHRAYVLRKNMLDPKLGRLRWPTQSEGRWRSTWYPNVISYGGGHQVREARWLRDPKYWQGHLRTWAENEKSDGVYPSHVTIAGPAGGQYADWITSTAWDGHLVHPDRAFLTQVVDKLAANVRGWQKQYDPDGDGLFLVDSHWWTGMEYQPSFFFFSNYRVARDFSEPERPTSLDRVDLTSYCYGNSVAVARIYHSLGQHDRAKDFDELAAKIAAAVQAKMWQPDKKFFYSLRTGDHAVADVKEVIGVYPFYFGMVPWGKGYEAAWSAIIDPDQFWTKWPVASASRQCPAFSQTNWPGDGRAAVCMWNGPTWPHANSLVTTAMARTLRAARDQKVANCPLERRHLWELFSSFTRAQYRNQDMRYPWTGEFYNGDTGQWKTAERDYNHSTWLDILIPELLGVVPHEDEVFEIDPLLPETALSYFLLDGLRYHGHDVAIAWDSPDPGSADRFDDRRKGLDVYVDGKRVASAERLSRLRIDLGKVSSPGS